MAMSAKKLLEAIATNGAAMSVLDSPACAYEEGRPPRVHRDGPLRGTVVLTDDGVPDDPGEPGRTLGDMVREIVGGDRG